MALARYLISILVLFSLLAIPRHVAAAEDDFDIPGGHFYTQARGGAAAGTGYSVTDADDVPFWTWFKRYGGVEKVGYPVSHRFQWKGFVSQAFQKVVFQYRPDQGGAVAFVNVFDELAAGGKDDWLAVVRDVPNSAKWDSDDGKSWPDVVQNHYKVLDKDPAIKALYMSDTDPVTQSGLPMAYEDMQNVAVVRAQRKVFQRWKIDVPWAKAGTVLVANGGDVGKEAGLYPPDAVVPKVPSEIPSIVNQAAPATTAPAAPAPAATANPQSSSAAPTATGTPTHFAAATNTPAPAATATPTNTPGGAVPFTIPTGPTPNPLAGSCDDMEHHPERSMLKNTSFDGAYNGGVPESWTPFQKGTVTFGEETGNEKFDRASWRIDGVGDFVAGGYQVVGGLKPGKWYQGFFATAQQVWGPGGKDGSLPLLREMGLDPTGGTDPYAPTVIWGRPAGGQPDKDAKRYGGWKTVSNNNNPLVSMIAVTDKMTIFLRVHGWPDVVKGDAWFDSAYFYEACDSAFKR
jgi:hypothetical protein